jgi:hypothetical protein
LKEVFTSELALNEKTVIDFCNDILSDKYWKHNGRNWC